MAKTIFVNGTYVLSNWLNSIFGGGAKSMWVANQAYAAGDIRKLSGGEILRAIVAGISGTEEPTAPGALRGTVVDNTVTWELFGGHLHDARAMDGSAPKVLLTEAAEVEGKLPAANVEWVDELIEYDHFTATFTTNKVMTFYYQKFTSGIVKLWYGEIQGLDNSYSHVADNTPVPTSIRPDGMRYITAYGSTTQKYIELILDSNGAIAFAANDGASQFTIIYSQVVEYYKTLPA